MGQGDSRILKEPWRRFNNFNEWSDEAHRNFTKEIAEYKSSQKSFKPLNIGFIGYMNAGKTSFISTISSIDIGRPSQVGPIGDTGETVTKSLKVVPLEKNLNDITLYDTMGLHEGSAGLKTEYIEALINGNLGEKFEFENVDGKPERYKHDPSPKDKMKCMVFVADINMVAQTNVSDTIRRTIGYIMKKIRSHGIPAFAILTKVDTLCDEVNRDVTYTYKSVAVHNAVKKASALFQMPEMNIFPVQNYTSTLKTDFKMEILTLLALRTMLQFADDYLSNDDD